MTSKLEKKLTQELMSSFVNNKFSKVISIFVNFRKLIEIRSIKKRYPIINFYCDWLLHSKIDRNIYLYEFLHNINIGMHGQGTLYVEDKITFKDYIDVVIHALNLDILLNEIIDFFHFFQINMPLIEGDIKILGQLIYLPENSDKTKFLIERGNLDVGIEFITPGGHSQRKAFLIELFNQLIDVPICYPASKLSNIKNDTFKEIKKIQQKLNLIKLNDERLDSNFNYELNPFVINSFNIEQVVGNKIHVNMGVEDKEIFIKGQFDIQ